MKVSEKSFCYTLAAKIKRQLDSLWGTKYQVVKERSNPGSRQQTGMRGTAGSSNKRQINLDSNTFGTFDIEPYLDFRGIGKSTRCNVDHSKFHCILPYTSLK
jgi:hypothetical protein